MAVRTSYPAHQWPNWLNVILAVWLFISPWVLGFGYGGAETAPAVANGAAAVNNVAGTAAWNAWIVAVIVGLLSIAAASRFAPWEEWVNVVLGVWLFFSPWILGYAGLYAATWNSLIVGFLIAGLAIWAVMAARRVTTRVDRVDRVDRVETEPRTRL
jgi:hypothetical protein